MCDGGVLICVALLMERRSVVPRVRSFLFIDERE